MENPTPNTTQTKFCKYCGAQIPVQAVICPSCGGQVEEFKQAQAPQQAPIIITNTNTNTNTNVGIPTKKPKNKWVAFFLCLFLGEFGAHKFYEGKIGMGILYLFTGGLFLVGWVIDLFRHLFKPNPYYV